MATLFFIIIIIINTMWFYAVATWPGDNPIGQVVSAHALYCRSLWFEARPSSLCLATTRSTSGFQTLKTQREVKWLEMF